MLTVEKRHLALSFLHPCLCANLLVFFYGKTGFWWFSICLQVKSAFMQEQCLYLRIIIIKLKHIKIHINVENQIFRPLHIYTHYMCAELVTLQVFPIMIGSFLLLKLYQILINWDDIFYAGCQPQAELLTEYQPNGFAINM